jgi:hypothetical protein
LKHITHYTYDNQLDPAAAAMPWHLMKTRWAAETQNYYENPRAARKLLNKRPLI